MQTDGNAIKSFFDNKNGADILGAIQAESLTQLNFDNVQTYVTFTMDGGAITTTGIKKDGPTNTSITFVMPKLKTISPKLWQQIQSMKQGDTANIGEFTVTMGPSGDMYKFDAILMSGSRIVQVGTEQGTVVELKLGLKS